MPTWSKLLYQHDTLAIAQGDVKYYSSVHKFGANFDIDIGTAPESIWTAGGLYPWGAFVFPAFLKLVSTETADTSNITLEGLDEDGKPLIVVMQMQGTTVAQTNVKFSRIYRMEYDGGILNAGTITATVTLVLDYVVAQIEPQLAQTLMAIYTVPKGYTAYMTSLDFSLPKGKDAQIRLYTRETGSSFKIKHLSEVYQNAYRYNFDVPLILPELTDIDMAAAEVETANTRVSANFELILVDNLRPNT